ncbi:MAG: acetolactate decarboxylase [Acidobacteriota bacterium]|nr:acetolactate decarboxylase [Acidobacteriota bacterium]
MQPNLHRPLFLILILAPALGLALTAWAGSSASPVETHGSLRAMMHEGAIGAAVSLNSLLPDPQVCAVGALAELAGEITVLGGQAYLAYPAAGEPRVEVTGQSEAGAALLVSSRVTEWQSLTLEEPIPFESLGAEIRRLASGAGFDVEGPFPFLVEGALEDLEWHVIDGSQLPEGPSSHQAHRSAGVRSSLARADGTLVGFYSTEHQGVFTHMGSTTHVHCVLEDPVASGHVDHVTLPAGARLRLPAPQSPSQASASD